MATTTALTNEGKQAKPLTQALCRITVERSGYELNSIQLQFIYLFVGFGGFFMTGPLAPCEPLVFNMWF